MLVSTDRLDALIEWLMPASLGLRVYQLIMAANELMLCPGFVTIRSLLSSLWAIDHTGA
jgi:hypothetical protein